MKSVHLPYIFISWQSFPWMTLRWLDNITHALHCAKFLRPSVRSAEIFCLCEIIFIRPPYLLSFTFWYFSQTSPPATQANSLHTSRSNIRQNNEWKELFCSSKNHDVLTLVCTYIRFRRRYGVKILEGMWVISLCSRRLWRKTRNGYIRCLSLVEADKYVGTLWWCLEEKKLRSVYSIWR